MRHLDRELDVLKRNILLLTGKVEENLQSSLRALLEKDRELAERIMEADAAIDRDEVEIEEDCLKILALHQPVAADLRFVVGVLKMDNDLERIGDIAVNIAERARYLATAKVPPGNFDFQGMGQKVLVMVRESINAFINGDTAAAAEVCRSDDEVDSLNRDVYRLVQEQIRQNPEHMEALIHMLSVSRHLERAADYATNIAEDVIYMVEGRIVRHQPEDFISQDSKESSESGKDS